MGFYGAMLRALSGLPYGLGRFIPCHLGANHCRLRLLAGKDVVMVLRLGFWRLLVLAS